MNLVKYTLLFTILLNFSGVKGQILTGPVLGGQATMAKNSTQYDGADFRQDLSLNYLGGWSYAYDINDNIAFYSELLYSRKGKIQHYNAISTRLLRHEAYAHFLEVPLMMRFSRPLGRGRARWFVNVGPQVSYWLGGRGLMSAYDFFGSSEVVQLDYKVNFSESADEGILGIEEANRIQFGLAAGGGVSIPVNRQGHQVAINFRYTSGTTFMAGNESVEIGSTEIADYLGYKYNALQISAAYVVPINLVGLRKGKSSNKVRHRR